MKFAPLDTFSRLRMVSLGDAVGTRLAVLATLDASGVAARLVLHGAVLRFRVHRDRLATSYRLVLDFGAAPV